MDEGRLSGGADELKDALEDPAFAEMHPVDAEKRGLVDGVQVRLTTAAGDATVPLRITEHVAAGSVFVPFNQPGLAANTLLSGRSTASVSVEAVGDGSTDGGVRSGRRPRDGRSRMTGIDWVLLVGRVIVVFVALLLSVLLYIWMERKVIADFQTRTGPMRAGPRGVLVTFADGLKLFFKESILPTNADRPVYLLAPILATIPAFLAFSVIPFGAPVTIFGRTVPLQLADLNIGVLWVLAMTSIGVYAVVLAGWSSGSNYPLLGAVRSTAQMVSYEVAMSLALVAVIMFSGHLKMSEIVAQQDKVWNVIPQFPAFVVFLICALAEVNRPPFDLAEAESELVAGFHTEYSGIRFALFYLGEYVNTVTVSAIAVTLFLGGWRGWWPFHGAAAWLGPVLWFVLKVTAVIYVYILVRGTLPRMRYDRLMNFGWKYLIPFGLFWVLATGAIVVLPDRYGHRRGAFIAIGLIVAVWLVMSLVKQALDAPRAAPAEELAT